MINEGYFVPTLILCVCVCVGVCVFVRVCQSGPVTVPVTDFLLFLPKINFLEVYFEFCVVLEQKHHDNKKKYLNSDFSVCRCTMGGVTKMNWQMGKPMHCIMVCWKMLFWPDEVFCCTTSIVQSLKKNVAPPFWRSGFHAHNKFSCPRRCHTGSAKVTVILKSSLLSPVASFVVNIKAKEI